MTDGSLSDLELAERLHWLYPCLATPAPLLPWCSLMINILGSIVSGDVAFLTALRMGAGMLPGMCRPRTRMPSLFLFALSVPA